MRAQTAEAEPIYLIATHNIKVSDENVRETQRDKDLEELAASIERHGLLQPVLLRGTFSKPPYQLIVGQRRLLAHRRILEHRNAKWLRIRAIFASDISDTDATLKSLVENMQRVDLNHADAAKAVTALYKAYGGRYSRDDRRVSRETGMSLRRVRQYIEIEEMASPAMKKKLHDRQVTPTDVKRTLVAAGGSIKKAERLLDIMVEEGLTEHQRFRIAEYGREHKDASAAAIVAEARRPRVERQVIVTLRSDLRTALQRAVDELAMAPEEVATQAIEDWLSSQGFYER
ncbi:MAG: ParB/RepB/Spo0J family partition protein [Armatimonadota bacterium]|jgi:ParB/RepB/Spo0J family partition protein